MKLETINKINELINTKEECEYIVKEISKKEKNFYIDNNDDWNPRIGNIDDELMEICIEYFNKKIEETNEHLRELGVEL